MAELFAILSCILAVFSLLVELFAPDSPTERLNRAPVELPRRPGVEATRRTMELKPPERTPGRLPGWRGYGIWRWT